MSSCVCVHTNSHISLIYWILLGYSILLVYRITAIYFLLKTEMQQYDSLPKAESSALLKANL